MTQAHNAETVRTEKWSDCPSYDGVPQYGGPCWTCQGLPEQCPLFWTAAQIDGDAGA